jgi:glycosyltransferase involved in cell wall biosynthesis
MTSYVTPAAPDDLALAPVPSFSVVIPAYQAATVVGDAIESVLAQTVQPCEIIVCNDGSTDDLHAALAPFMSRLRLIDKDNGGEASAKNAGIRAATGDFVAFLDADDVFLPRRLERLGGLASLRPDLDLLTTDSYLVVNGERVRNCYVPEFRFAASDQRAAILRYNFLPFVAVRREALIAVGGFDETLRNVPDWDLWLRMILAGSRAGLVDEALAEYRLHSTNVTSDRARVHRGKLETLEKTKRRLDLSEAELAIVEEGITEERRALALWDARDALRVQRPDARRACLRLLRTKGIGVGARMNATAGILAPRLASRVLERRDRAGVETTAGLRVKAPSIRGGPSDVTLEG